MDPGGTYYGAQSEYVDYDGDGSGGTLGGMFGGMFGGVFGGDGPDCSARNLVIGVFLVVLFYMFVIDEESYIHYSKAVAYVKGDKAKKTKLVSE